MHTIRRSCQSAVSSARHGSLSVNGARRAFSRSCSCPRGALPQFLEPSSPELANVLSRFNSKVLLPEHLTKEQRKLVYKKENLSRLDAEPIEITLGEITLPLEHIDRNRDRPSRWETIRDVIERSKTADDWENVVRMMEGFQDASIHLKPQWFEKIVRRLNQAEMHHLVLKSLQRADRTGLRLRDEGVVLQVFKGLHDKAVQSQWDEGETKKALSFSEQCVELMDGKEHLGKTSPAPNDMRASPFVIAVPLELAAMRAKRHTGGEDRDGKVKKYASRLMVALEQDNYYSTILPAKLEQLTSPRLPENSKAGHVRNVAIGDLKRQMFAIIPLWNALRTSNQVLNVNMPRAEVAQKTERGISEALAKGQAILQEEVKKGFLTNIGYVGEAMKQCEDM